MSIKLSPTAIIREAKRIKTTPSVLATRALKFKGKPDCERLVRFIKSSGEELSKVSIPNSKSLVKGMGGGGKDGGLGDIASNDFIKKKIRSLPLLHELEVYVNEDRSTIIQRIDGGLLYHSKIGTKINTTFVAREHNR